MLQVGGVLGVVAWGMLLVPLSEFPADEQGRRASGKVHGSCRHAQSAGDEA